MTGKNIIITGASRGFGKYLASYLHDQGATLLLIARDISYIDLRRNIFSMFDTGLEEVRFRFDFEGTKIVTQS